jgi:hypothetical protein
LSLSTRPPEEENELARSLVCQRATGIFFHPSERQINTCGNAGARVDVSVPDP